MANPKLSRELALEAVLALKTFIDRGYTTEPAPDSLGSAFEAASKGIGKDQGTLRNRIEKAWEYYGIRAEDLPDLDDVEISEDSDRPNPFTVFGRHLEYNEGFIAKKRRKPAVLMVPPQPFAVAFIGDPHLSNKGTSLKALKDDLEILRVTRTRAVQMGDLLDNFHKVPKLAEKEAQNRMSLVEGLSLAEWLVCESGVKFDAHVLGNHDAWLGYEGVQLMGSWVHRAKSRLYDWNARLIYKWGPGQHEQHVVQASHDIKGHSQYNPTHGPGKMALWDGTADTYVAAHRHNHAEAKVPNAWRGKTYQLIRVRGYKDYDDYGEGRAQFPSHAGMEGRSALLVVNPLSETHDGRQRVFMDLGEGIEFMQMLKRRAA